MIIKRKDPVAARDIKSEEIIFDKKTSLKIHQHLSDERDEISEQDIKNVRTDFNEINYDEQGLNISQEETANDKDDKYGKKETGGNTDTKEDSSIITPWNIFDS